VEGVLERILSVVAVSLTSAEPEERIRAECLKAEIADAKAGDFPITLILEDPTGNSAIVSDRAIQEPFVCADDGAHEE
jgi:zinc finger protein